MKIKKITRQDMAERAAELWKECYYNHVEKKWHTTISGDSSNTYKALKTLKETTPGNVNEIIGNRSWTRLKCFSCDADCNEVIEVTDATIPRSFQLCKECLEIAINTIK